MAILNDTANSASVPVERKLDDYYTENPGTEKAAAPTPAVATGYEAETGSLDPSKTASGQMLDITSQDSPLMQRAEQQGVLTAARRGLQNTSIAAGTAQGAMVDRAMPLAQQNASMMQTQDIENQRALNRAAEVSTGRETETERFNVASETDVNKFNVAESNQMIADVMNQNAKVNLQGLTGNQSIDLQSMENDTKMAITKHQTAASMYQSYANSVASLFANTSLTPDRMTAMVTGLKNTLAGGSAFVEGMSSLDLSGALDPARTVSNTGIYTAPAPAPAPAPYVPPPAPYVNKTWHPGGDA